MKNFKAISRSLRLITAGMLTCAVAFTAAAGFCPSRVNGDSIKRTAVDRHNYMTEWFCSAPLMSYIVSLDDGGYMVFYVKADIMYSENGYDVEYYDSSFNFVKYKHIDSELARIDDSISRAARAVLFEPDKRDHAIQLVGQKTALTDLLNTLKSLETTTREGK